MTEFHISEAELLIIENVGNLVCPAEFDLGEDLRVMVFSAVEGVEKPQKYPLMFQTADAVLLNKIDLIPYSGVSLEELTANVRKVNPSAPIFPVSVPHRRRDRRLDQPGSAIALPHCANETPSRLLCDRL